MGIQTIRIIFRNCQHRKIKKIRLVFPRVGELPEIRLTLGVNTVGCTIHLHNCSIHLEIAPSLTHI